MFWAVENMVPAHRNFSGCKENKLKKKIMWVVVVLVDEDEKIVNKGQILIPKTNGLILIKVLVAVVLLIQTIRRLF